MVRIKTDMAYEEPTIICNIHFSTKYIVGWMLKCEYMCSQKQATKPQSCGCDSPGEPPRSKLSFVV